MLTVRFYTFSKKECSTKQPGISDAYTEYSCLLKSGTGVISPALEIRTDTNPSVWNYCFIVEFDRYYFVQEWTYNMGEWICSLKVDVLASWKANIESGSQYILRAGDATVANLNLIDDYPATSTQIQHNQKVFGSDLSIDLESNTPRFMLGVINADGQNQPFAISYYALTSSQMHTLKNYLLTDNQWIGNVDPSATSVEKNQSKVEINPYQYIVSCKYFPFDIPVIKSGGTPVSRQIKVGWWTTSAYGYVPDDYTVQLDYTTGLQLHPQIGRGYYLASSNYTNYMLDWAGYHFNIPGNSIWGANNIKVILNVDLATGQAHCRVLGLYVEGGNTTVWCVGEQTQDFAVNIPVTQITWEGGKGVGFVNSITSAVSTITGRQVRLNSLREVASVVAGDTFGGSYNSQPGSLSALRAHLAPMLTWSFVIVSGRSIYDEGLPVCEELVINTIASGYILCRDAHLSLPATEPEMQEVINYLNGGFFYE